MRTWWHKQDRRIRPECRETQILETMLLGRKKGVLLGTARHQMELPHRQAMTYLRVLGRRGMECLRAVVF
jgi:hypothetical protein